MFVATLAHAATNDLSGLLQRGLFEEEANRNLEAASAAYESLVKQLDKDRQIGATAIFRLGEVYRKQGKTNEAAAQYERIVRDFAEQTTLVTLSRQNLAGLGMHRRSANTSSEPTGAASSSADARMLNQLKKLSRAELRGVLPGVSGDPTLSQLLNELNTAERKRVEISADFSESSPQMQQNKSVLELLNKKIDERMDGILRGMELRVAAAEETGEITKPSKSASSTFTAVLDEEEAEIRRIQAMIQNSPDLINATSGDRAGTPLGRAAEKGQLRVAQYLLDNDAEVNFPANGSTPLSIAAWNGHKKMVELLLARGAAVNTFDGNGRTPLLVAVVRNFPSVMEVLLAAKADPNVGTADAHTPLMAAVQQGSLPIRMSSTNSRRTEPFQMWRASATTMVPRCTLPPPAGTRRWRVCY
jgi:hypothetical protein